MQFMGSKLSLSFESSAQLPYSSPALFLLPPCPQPPALLTLLPVLPPHSSPCTPPLFTCPFPALFLFPDCPRPPAPFPSSSALLLILLPHSSPCTPSLFSCPSPCSPYFLIVLNPLHSPPHPPFFSPSSLSVYPTFLSTLLPCPPPCPPYQKLILFLVYFSRLLEVGGATLVNGKPPYSASLADKLTHVYVESTSVKDVQPLKESGVPCLSTDYIPEFILQVLGAVLCVPYDLH